MGHKQVKRLAPSRTANKWCQALNSGCDTNFLKSSFPCHLLKEVKLSNLRCSSGKDPLRAHSCGLSALLAYHISQDYALLTESGGIISTVELNWGVITRQDLGPGRLGTGSRANLLGGHLSCMGGRQSTPSLGAVPFLGFISKKWLSAYRRCGAGFGFLLTHVSDPFHEPPVNCLSPLIPLLMLLVA